MKHPTKEDYVSNLKPSDLTIYKLVDTIGQAYIDGITYAENRYKEAIITAMTKCGINPRPFYNIILDELNNHK